MPTTLPRALDVIRSVSKPRQRFDVSWPHLAIRSSEPSQFAENYPAILFFLSLVVASARIQRLPLTFERHFPHVSQVRQSRGCVLQEVRHRGVSRGPKVSSV